MLSYIYEWICHGINPSKLCFRVIHDIIEGFNDFIGVEDSNLMRGFMILINEMIDSTHYVMNHQCKRGKLYRVS